MKTILLSVAVFVGVFGYIDAETKTKESVQIIDHPHKNEYTSVVAGTDKHKYGYELKENRHFHHTTTEEDGVRLGCYGYVLEGKKYSTQYVADVKGYRPVLTHDAITVYPKSGGERKASFVGDFKEDQQRSENIRYFFPDGCKGSDIVSSPAEFPLPNPPVRINIKPDQAINPPKSIPKKPVEFIPIPQQSIQPARFVEPPFVINVESPKVDFVQTTPKPTQRPTTPTTPKKVPTTPRATKAPVKAKPVTQKPFVSAPKQPSTALLTKIAVPTDFMLNKISNAQTKDSCSKSCCADDENVAKLVLPISMKSLGKTTGSCETFAKLVIPVEGLNPDSLKSLTRGTGTAELIKTILQSLS